jgi:GNAT superfamily N-acetyltransferase
VKQLGPNIFVGDDPYTCLLAAQIENENKRRVIQDEFNQKLMAPADKFLSLLNGRTTKPKRFGFMVDHSYVRFGEHVLISIAKTSRLTGVPDCNKFMCHLESIYVVDAARGQGIGTSCMDMITEIAEESGCVVDLFCNPFVWSRDGENKYAIESFEQLWGIVFDEKWDVLYHKDLQKELTKFFYTRSGFVNMCLYDEWVYQRDKDEDLPFEQQFAFLPSTLKPAYRQQLEIRLKSEGCGFCNRP